MTFRPTVVATLSFLGLCATAAPAFALDAYRDRTGLFYGAGAGFGAARVDETGAETKAGLNLDARVGGGVSQNLTLDFDLGYTRQLGVDTNLVTGFVGVNVFPVGDFFLRLMGGIAYAALEDDNSTGFGAGVGLGYEFWANADLAASVGANFQHHFYDQVDFNAVNLGLTFAVY